MASPAHRAWVGFLAIYQSLIHSNRRLAWSGEVHPNFPGSETSPGQAVLKQRRRFPPGPVREGETRPGRQTVGPVLSSSSSHPRPFRQRTCMSLSADSLSL